MSNVVFQGVVSNSNKTLLMMDNLMNYYIVFYNLHYINLLSMYLEFQYLISLQGNNYMYTNSLFVLFKKIDLL